MTQQAVRLPHGSPKSLKGIVVPIGAPLDDRESVDEVGLRSLTRYLLEQGVHGIMANGSMGGFALLEDLEQLRLLEIVLDEVGGRVPVIANVGETGTRRALRKARDFEALGPNYLALLPPFYFLISQAELRTFYEHLADNVRTPVLLYNNPVLTKCEIELDTILHLAEHPNIVGLKDSKQDFDKWLRMVRTFRETEFSILVGTESLVAAALASGCDGVTGGLHNICPGVAVEIYNAVQSGDLARADALQVKLNALFAIFERENPWGGFEAALQHLGLCSRMTAHPYGPIVDAREREGIAAILEKNLGSSSVRFPRGVVS